MNILGITDGVVGGAAIIDENGNILAAVNEERLVRKKMAIGFPEQSINEVLRLAELTPLMIDQIAVATHDEYFRNPAQSWEGWFQGDRGILKEIQLFLASAVVAVFGDSAIFRKAYYLLRLPASRGRKSALDKVIRNTWGFTCPITFTDHHDAHVAAAYFTSGYQEATVISLDGGGDGKSCKVYEARNGVLKEIASVGAYDSMGNFYAYITHLCGFKAHKHEGKITGLAAHGKPVFKDYLATFINHEDGTITNTSKSFYHSSLRKLKAGLPANFSKEDLAASMQLHLEDVCTGFVQHWIKKTGLNKVAFAGGVVANVKLNQRLHEIPELSDIYIFPAMGDDGLAMGAAYWLRANLLPEHPEVVNNTYQPAQSFWGAGYTNDEVKNVLDQQNISYEYHENIEDVVAELLSKGRVVARFAGRMEYGPRALGNRSILYQPTDPSANDWLNKRLVRTEFMPFAPVTMKEYSSQCYLDTAGSEHAARFMTITYNCTEWMKEHCPAVVHIDGTARPQLIDKELEPAYYRILECYHEITGIPCIVNTSFNMHEEPIVNTPEDGVRAFLLGHLDYLAMENYLIKHTGERPT